MNKEEVLEKIKAERNNLYDLIHSLTDEQICEPSLPNGWSVKDVMMHIAEWEHRCAMWINAGLCQNTPHVPQEGYTWDDIDRLNADTYEDYKEMSLEGAQNYSRAVYLHFYEQLENLSEEEMTEPAHFSWTEKESLVPFIAANTYDHYREHRKQIQEWLPQS